MEFPTLFTPLPWNFQHFVSIFNPLLGISSPKMPPSMEFSIWKKIPSPHGIFQFLDRGGGENIYWNSPIQGFPGFPGGHTNPELTFPVLKFKFTFLTKNHLVPIFRSASRVKAFNSRCLVTFNLGIGLVQHVLKNQNATEHFQCQPFFND